ncbi:MAG: hypothetical protein A3J47_01585 [Candidatus Yanofskybacteria bacterium RIFCSPHIGHO2_02_FULL_43_22]|uniref:NfeD-like C-terminal domain-containing protein n=1 Tax=Candidatus Yanofskybacteria bacterium RIFCSPHIGHO2_02_FULL_43_22 TaxID=1802681 RepID=A0A1F8FLL1_9BACT|nr:MAG: hypothetical protein A3J47_01585 [Candidatus Yanofskybacteria bacterium RIFCSPHIGHO2_02_FULL_43_22]
MFEAVFFFIVGNFVVGLGVAIAAIEDEARWLGISVLGIVFLGFATFGFAPRALPTGAPATSIDAGEHGVAYVGPSEAGHVDVLIFRDGQDSELSMTYYRFPKEAFDGQVNTEATKLVVVKVDGFKKLVLK